MYRNSTNREGKIVLTNYNVRHSMITREFEAMDHVVSADLKRSGSQAEITVIFGSAPVTAEMLNSLLTTLERFEFNAQGVISHGVPRVIGSLSERSEPRQSRFRLRSIPKTAVRTAQMNPTEIPQTRVNERLRSNSPRKHGQSSTIVPGISQLLKNLDSIDEFRQFKNGTESFWAAIIEGIPLVGAAVRLFYNGGTRIIKTRLGDSLVKADSFRSRAIESTMLMVSVGSVLGSGIIGTLFDGSRSDSEN